MNIVIPVALVAVVGLLASCMLSYASKVFAVQGFLYPVTAGHVAVGTDYELYRYDLRGAARGAVQLFPFLYGGIRILLCKDVRRVISRIRRGPSSGHRYGNGSKNGEKKG